MKKISLLLIPLFFTANLYAVPQAVPNPPSVGAKSYLLIDFASGKVLAESNSTKSLEPASLTKMMTSYIIGNELKEGTIKLTDEVTISENAWSKNFPDSSKMFIEVGKKISIADLNRGIIIQSGNDACVAMAEHLSGNEATFVELMNSWAKQLGMKNTHFVNSHGLDTEEHYTTAEDMGILARALIRDVPEEYKIYSEKSFKYNNIHQYNRNALLWDKSLNVDGMKTGHTEAAGYSLVASATKGEMRLISVVMGTRSTDARKVESKKLLKWGFRFFETITPYSAGEKLVNARIWMGEKKNIKLGVKNSTPLTLPRGEAKNLEAETVIEGNLNAPIQKGDVIGKVNYTLAGKHITTFDLIALESVEKGGIFTRIIDYVKLLFMSFFE